MEKQNLVLFTNGFPCIKEGEEFLEKELDLLSAKFKNITIYVLVNAEVCRRIPSNVTVRFLGSKSGKKIRSVLLSNILTISSIIFSDIADRTARKSVFKNFKFYFNVLIGNFILKETLEEELQKMDLTQTKLYSYWCGPWFDILMLFDRKLTDSITFRAHGYDFDVNQRKEKFIPYRNYLMRKNPFISFISRFGYDTYTKRYPKYTNKKMYRLGVSSQMDNPPADTELKVIVSCSSLIPLKRVHLIVEILKNMRTKIKWVHLGHGPLLDEVKLRSKELGANISFEFKGQVAHADVIDYYKVNHVDLFMNVSELEGIPVSIMEAISFGIPVTGCNICGVPEIVTKETGFLWDVNFKPEAAAKQLDEYFSCEEKRKQDLRASTKAFWKKYFDADANHESFIKNCLLN